ncbi:MAG: hypothetical protein WBG54_04095 [Acidobacteriaceae bacterium]
MLLRGAIPEAPLSFSAWDIAGLAALALLLCLGAFTPLSCTASCVVQIAMRWNHPDRDPFQFGFSLAITTAFFLLGPGAFSVDSRLFGRRLIVRS